jgi:hypothetical protein
MSDGKTWRRVQGIRYSGYYYSTSDKDAREQFEQQHEYDPGVAMGAQPWVDDLGEACPTCGHVKERGDGRE